MFVLVDVFQVTMVVAPQSARLSDLHAVSSTVEEKFIPITLRNSRMWKYFHRVRLD